MIKREERRDYVLKSKMNQLFAEQKSVHILYSYDQQEKYIQQVVSYIQMVEKSVHMLEKTTRMNYLFDFYQALLTPKQRSYMSLYYLDDYSLGEIAEEFDVSRQAVYDNIKRTEQMLEQYEEKLLLFQRFQERQSIVQQLKDELAADLNKNSKLSSLLDSLEKLD